MSSILDKLGHITDPERADVLNLYSSSIIRVLEKEGDSKLALFLDNIYALCKVEKSRQPDFLDFLKDEDKWMHGFLYVAMCESARSILGDEGFYENFVLSVLTSERNSTIRHFPLVGMDRLYRYAAKSNNSLNALTEMSVDEERSRKGEYYVMRRTLPTYRQELEERLGPELTSQVLANDCLFTRLMITVAPKIVTGVPARLEEIACESKGAECCQYRFTYDPPSLWQRIKSWRRMRRDFVELQIDLIERNATIRQQTAELRQQTEELKSERQKIEELLNHIVPPEKINKMLKGDVEPEDVDATIMFADMCDFTKYAHGKPANDVFDFLNFQFNEMEKIIVSQGGYTVKYLGDCAMVTFGASFPNETHAVSSVLCGLRLQERARRSDDKSDKSAYLRIGVDTGPMAAGLVGARTNFLWDVVGEHINTAQRLTQHGRKDAVAISETTKAMVEAFFNVTRSDEKVLLKGYPRPVYIYFVDRLKRVSECPQRVGVNVEYFRALEDEVNAFQISALDRIDTAAYDAKDGDPLRSKTVALISYAIVKEMGYDISPDLIITASNLHEAGKSKILQSVLNRRYNDPFKKQYFQNEVMHKTLDKVSDEAANALPIIQDFYGERQTIPAQIIKAAQIYCGMACCSQRYKDRRIFSKDEVVEEMQAKGIPPEIIGSIAKLGLL